MNKKTPLLACLFLALLLLILPMAFAEEDEEEEENTIFDDWVTAGDTFQVSGLDVYVTAGTTGGEGIFIFPQKTIVLTENNCGMVDRLKVCLKEWEYVIGGTVRIHGSDTQKYRLAVSIPAPDVTISRGAEETKFEIGESTKVTITVKNRGNEPAVGLTYTETVPPEFFITMTTGLIQSGNKLTWQGSLPKEGEKKFSYIIQSKSGFSGNINAVLEYNVHGVPKKVEDSMNIVVSSLMSIGQKLEKSSIQYGEEERVYITVKNKRLEDMNTELYATFPESLHIVATHFNDTYADMYVWKGTIEGGESQELITRIRADGVGIQKINISVKGVFADYKRAEAQESIDVDVGVNDAELYFIPKKIKKGEESRIKVYLKNPNTYAEFKDLDISADSEHFNGTIHLNRFKVTEYNEVLNFDIKPEEAGTFNAKAEVVYYIGSKKFTVEKEEEIEVEEEEIEEPEPEVNETVQPEENVTVNETEEEEEAGIRWTEKELFVVGYARKNMNKIRDPIKMIFELKKAVREAVSGKNS